MDLVFFWKYLCLRTPACLVVFNVPCRIYHGGRIKGRYGVDVIYKDILWYIEGIFEGSKEIPMNDHNLNFKTFFYQLKAEQQIKLTIQQRSPINLGLLSA